VLLPKPRTRDLVQAHGGRRWIATDAVAGRETVFGQPGSARPHPMQAFALPRIDLSQRQSEWVGVYGDS